jgi:hypothetical protein
MAAYSHLRTTVFISYCHKDKDKYFDRLMVHLLPFNRDRKIHIWTDTMIPPGAMWPKAIEEAINSAKVAIFLVSADYLASDFIGRKELPLLLAAAKQERASIIPVVIKPCLYNHSPLQLYQAFNDTTRPLSMLKYDDRELIWMGVTELVLKLLKVKQAS